MKFKTNKEKLAFRIGCIVGSKKKNSVRKKDKKNTSTPVSPKRKSYVDDFEYTPSGRIKGSYTCDGFFEPD